MDGNGSTAIVASPPISPGCQELKKTSLQPLTLVDEGFTAVDASVHHFYEKNIFLKVFSDFFM